ncbi:hypothetical protein [Edaphobacter sp.]|uniref:hypothetical protein n=1 Tax=Edaphobacter sp. TaxID=1934404 RepID=UPI002DB94689|nr:hypothetical protein [Edaphobacter sp.]HEU5341453.1 hypothetical protein [Edaphobacter sp.]
MSDDQQVNNPEAEPTTSIDAVPDESQPPAVIPPKTKLPTQFNQQNNFYQQIPSNAWDRLSADQVVDLSKQILRHMDTLDERNYKFAMDQIDRKEARGRRNVWIGSIVVVIGFLVTAYLAAHGHEIVALTVSLPLATILAMLTGNRLLN